MAQELLDLAKINFYIVAQSGDSAAHGRRAEYMQDNGLVYKHRCVMQDRVITMLLLRMPHLRSARCVHQASPHRHTPQAGKPVTGRIHERHAVKNQPG